jgi:hypothetical protein
VSGTFLSVLTWKTNLIVLNSVEVTPSCPEFVIVWDNINTCMRADPSGKDTPRSQSSTSEIDEGPPDLLAEDGADGSDASSE